MNPHDHEGGIVGLLADLIVTAPARPPVKLTEPQRALLRCIRKRGHDGWVVVCEQFASLRGLPQHLEASACARVASALERKGLIVIGDDADEYPRLTPAGEALLAGGAA